MVSPFNLFIYIVWSVYYSNEIHTHLFVFIIPFFYFLIFRFSRLSPFLFKGYYDDKEKQSGKAIFSGSLNSLHWFQNIIVITKNHHNLFLFHIFIYHSSRTHKLIFLSLIYFTTDYSTVTRKTNPTEVIGKHQNTGFVARSCW